MWKTRSAIAAIRIGTLVLRFALTIYITAYLGVAEVGLFGLIVGLAVFFPALLGFGLNFHLCRDIAVMQPRMAIATLRDRLWFSVRVLAVGSLLALTGYVVGAGMPTALVWLAALVIIGECLGTDLYLGLTGMQRNVLANVAVALRSGSWILVAIALGVAEPAFRNLETVLACWAFGTFGSLALAASRLRSSPRPLSAEAAEGKGWAVGKLRAGLAIWPSDLALVAITFADRFILAPIVTERELGVYVFFWTFANTVQSLIQSSIVTPELPKLTIRFRDGRMEWLARVRSVGALIMGLSLALSAGALAFVYLVHSFIARANFPWDGALALLLFSGMIVRLASDYLSTALNSAGFVKQYVSLNLIYAGLVIALSFAGALAYGVAGTATGALAAAAIATFLKVMAIRKAIRR